MGRWRRPAVLVFALLAIVRVGVGQTARPSYRIDATVDYDLLAFKASAVISIPAVSSDTLSDAVFFLYANAEGIVDDARRKYVVVDTVRLQDAAIPFQLQHSVLRVSLPQPQSKPFSLQIDYHGVVPRGSSESGSGGLLGASAGESMGSLSKLLGLGGGESKAANSDYGLYRYSDGILSLSAFWYPQLAVRRPGKWADEEPAGLGDVAYADMADFDVNLTLPASVKTVTTGSSPNPPQKLPNGLEKRRYSARGVRDFAVLMSEDYVLKSQSVDSGGKKITVEAYAAAKYENRLDRVLDIAARSLDFYSRKFGPYPYGEFKVVEGTLGGGAGGMEFSGLTSIASMLYPDANEQLRALTGLLGIGGLDPAKPAEANQSMAGMMSAFLAPQMELLDSMLEMTIAHEVAHQWWAIAVGSDSIRDPFVDESLTNYSAVLYFEDRYGSEKAAKMIDLHLKTPYSLARMLGEPDAPADLPASGYSGNLQYGAVVYGKGALYYDAVRKAMGDAAFFSSLHDYYGKYAGSLAGPRALLDIFESKAPAAGVDKLYQRWVEEAHGDEDIQGGALSGIQELLGRLLRK